MMKVFGFLIGVLVTVSALAGTKPKKNETPKPVSNTQAKPDMVKMIFHEILSKIDSRKNIQFSGTLTLGSESKCLAKEGSKAFANIKMIDVLSFNFGKPEEDPNYALILEAAQKGLVINATVTFMKDCVYSMDVVFKQVVNAEVEKSGVVSKRYINPAVVFVSEDGTAFKRWIKPELIDATFNLKLKMELTGQLLNYRVSRLRSKLITGVDLKTAAPTILFEGNLDIDQELADFAYDMSAVPVIKNKEGIEAPEVMIWQPISANIIYDGEFKIVMDARADLPDSALKKPHNSQK